MRKKHQTRRILGPAVLFCALFLPGYLYQSPEAAAAALTEPLLLVQNIVLGLPQTVLILYVILTRGHSTKEAAGIVRIRFADILKVIAGTAGLFAFTLTATLIAGNTTEGLFTSVIPETVQPVVYLLFVPVCLVTGYREELFFRSYLLTELAPFGTSAGVAFGSLLFALGHIYQGAGAFLLTALIGVFLSWLFLRTRNVHIVALSHGIYNYLVLLGGTLL